MINALDQDFFLNSPPWKALILYAHHQTEHRMCLFVMQSQQYRTGYFSIRLNSIIYFVVRFVHRIGHP